MDEEWITTRQAASRSGYSQEYVRELSRKGKIKSKRVGLTLMLEIESLMAYKQMQEALQRGPRSIE